MFFAIKKHRTLKAVLAKLAFLGLTAAPAYAEDQHIQIIPGPSSGPCKPYPLPEIIPSVPQPRPSTETRPSTELPPSTEPRRSTEPRPSTEPSTQPEAAP